MGCGDSKGKVILTKTKKPEEFKKSSTSIEFRQETDASSPYNTRTINKQLEKVTVLRKSMTHVTKTSNKRMMDCIEEEMKEMTPVPSMRSSGLLANLLLGEYVKVKAKLYSFIGNKDISLVSKGYSIRSLDNRLIDSVNFNVKRIKKIYKNQKVPRSNEKFVDDLFPPNNDSLMGMKKGVVIDKITERVDKMLKSFPFKKEDIVWLSAKEIMNKYSLFTNEIDVDDILQGNIGNCYLMSSLSAMANYPQLICQLFPSFDIPSNDCYQVGVRVNGEWKIVLLDDYFPCHAKTRLPIFAKPRGAELWVMLLEKAWAKINGGYLYITGGWASEVLSCFTSFAIENMTFKKYSMDFIWEGIKSNVMQGNIISAYSLFNKEIEKLGLISGHAFTVTDYREGIIKDSIVRILRLRNPWGYREWNGPWCDKSPQWTEEARTTLNCDNQDEDDGNFWMSFEDFYVYFMMIEVCKVVSPQCVKMLTVEKENLSYPSVYELQLFSRTKVTVQVIKKYYRFHRTMKSDSELLVNIIVVKKNENGKLEYVASTHENEANPMLEFTARHGYYLIYIQANYKYSNFDKMRKYSLFVSANKYFDVFLKGTDRKFSLLKRIIKDRYDRDGKFKTGNKFENTTYGYVYFPNDEDEFSVNYKILDKSLNYEILTQYNQRISISKGGAFVMIGNRKKYYEDYKFDVEFQRTKNETENFSMVKTEDLSEFIQNSPDHELDEDNFDFIFKKFNLETDHIVEKIDHIKLAREYFMEKYPQQMSLILTKVEPPDTEHVIFRDIYEHGPNCYLGEWKTKEELVRHGRGIAIFEDGSSYVGQFRNDMMDGDGVLYKNNEKIEIRFKSDVMDGMGKLYKANGEIVQVHYKNGERIL